MPIEKRYDIKIEFVNSTKALANAKFGTVQGGFMFHSPSDSETYKISINSIRGDYKNGTVNKNRLRMWEKSDFIPRPDDIFQERLYCVQWMKKKPKGL